MPALRQRVLAGASAIIVLLYSPGGFGLCAFLLLVPMCAQIVYSRVHRPWLFWLFISLSVCPLIGLRALTEQSFVVSFGVAFATVKSIALVFIAYGRRQQIRFGDAALLIFFFPLFTVGPVERLKTFAVENFSTQFQARFLLSGIYRVATGLFLIMFVCDQVLAPMRITWLGNELQNIEGFTRWKALALIVTSFLYTYLNFEGFSSLAIGLSRLFGLKIVENFDRPLLVTNVADFWKRYHISMGNWINQHLYFPLVIWIKRPGAEYVASVTVFVLFGLWHAFTLNYVAWGLANGIGVAVVHAAVKRGIFPLSKKTNFVRGLVALGGGIATLVYVSWAQTIANLSSVQAAVALTAKLLLGR